MWTSGHGPGVICSFASLKIESPQLRIFKEKKTKRGRIHSYLSRVRVGRGSIQGHLSIWREVVKSKKVKRGPTNRLTDGLTGCRLQIRVHAIKI